MRWSGPWCSRRRAHSPSAIWRPIPFRAPPRMEGCRSSHRSPPSSAPQWTRCWPRPAGTRARPRAAWASRGPGCNGFWMERRNESRDPAGASTAGDRKVTSPVERDLVTDLKALLAQGRYREVLERYGPHRTGAAPPPPAVALAVATAATRLGSLDTGEDLAGSALRGFRQRADDDGRMRCLNLLGAIAFERGSLDEASARYSSSLDLSRALSDLQSWARASNNLAIVAYLRGRIEESRSLFREALLAYQRLGDRRGLAETHHNLGIVAREAGELEEAARATELGTRHAVQVGDPALLALTTTGQAETALADGALAVAREALDRAERLAREAGDEVGVAEVERVRALCWLRQGEPMRALEAAERGRALAERYQSTQIQGECAALVSTAARLLGRRAEAAQRFAEAERLFVGLGAVLHLERLRAESHPAE